MKVVSLLVLEEESRPTLHPFTALTTTRHVETRDYPFSFSCVVDGNGYALILGIWVSGVLKRIKRTLVNW